jgi:hypothetical protein
MSDPNDIEPPTAFQRPPFTKECTFRMTCSADTLTLNGKHRANFVDGYSCMELCLDYGNVVFVRGDDYQVTITKLPRK